MASLREFRIPGYQKKVYVPTPSKGFPALPCTVLGIVFIDIKFAMIVVCILAAIAAIEAGIIGGLATRVGSLQELFRLTAAVADKNSHKAS
ncbi:hypothetical protein ACFLUO_04160 [Chloroflexota bacterium]